MAIPARPGSVTPPAQSSFGDVGQSADIARA
jgi:hypothetical protein